jgi:phospholipid/cholesterol/gamma-HCH transport system permease protein
MTRIALYLIKSPLHYIHLFISEIGNLSIFTQSTFAAILSPPYKKTITRKQMDEIGVGSLPVVTLTGLFMGLVLALQSIVELRSIGATSYIGRPISTTVVRELGPVLASIMVTARAGSAIAAELASMVVNEQIDAMKAEGSNPVKKLVEPRVLACTFMMPVLTIICDVIAFVGGWIVACRIVQITSSFYWNSVFEVLTPAFVLGGLLKSVIFGFVIGIVSCHAGMKTRFGATGVGEATTRAVVISSISILMIDFVITKIFIMTWW